ncbi:MAG: hypothetical protein ACYCZJ_13130 [Sulfuriferula sp.]
MRLVDNLVVWGGVALCLIPTVLIVPVLLLLPGGNTTRNILIGIDQLWNALARGNPTQTISARAWMSRGDARWMLLVKILDQIQPDHCRQAFLNEVAAAKRLVYGPK